MTDRDSMENNDFRVVASSSVYQKGTAAGGLMSNGGQSGNRYRYTLGEVCSTNITLDVNVGTGWTRIRLKGVPKFIVHAFNMITKYGMEIDGIFRKEGNSARLNRAEIQTIYKGQCDIPNDYTVIDVCTMVKRFLRDLKPPLLDSEEFRARLLKKACQSRISDCYVLTRDEMADLFYVEDGSKERQSPLLSDIHSSTLGYVMRQLNRCAAHSERHRMSIENLAVVLVGSVFGDGIHDPKKSGQFRRGSKDDILAQKKQDMNVNVAAVKLLITNANLIGIRRDPYVTSNAMLRSSSAMPRCMSSGYETGSSEADCMQMGTSSSLKSEEVAGPSMSSYIYRRDSEAAHKIVTARKKGDLGTKKKRSASFLPSFRDIRHRLTNMKRAKSPSPERLMTGHSAETLKLTDTSSSDMYSDLQRNSLIHRKKVDRNDSNTLSTGSTASGRQSRSQQARRGNTNAAPRNVSATKLALSKMFDSVQGSYISNSGALRRLSASDQNSDAVRFASHRLSNERMSVTEFLISEHEKERNSKIQKRNTMILCDNSKSSRAKHTNRRHTAPVNNNRLRRNRPNTVGAGLPHRKESFFKTNSSMEEKENHADCETDDTIEPTESIDNSQLLLEQKALEARSRRAGRKQKAALRNNVTESMLVLNESITAESSAKVVKAGPLVLESLKEESPLKASPQVILRKDLEEVKNKQFCDMATSPMIIDPQKSSSHENGHVWVGTKQVITVTPTPNITRHRSRARLSYSKATVESPLEMPANARREASSLISPVLNHVTITNNSPPSQVVTAFTPRTSITPKSHPLSPLVLCLDRSTPPPVPPHSPPHLTPQTSKGSVVAAAEVKRVSGSNGGHQRRPPTPPSNPRVSNPFSPKLPIRSVTIDNEFDLPGALAPEAVPTLFKLPQLPLPKKTSQSHNLSLTRQPYSTSKPTVSSPNRDKLRESKSIEETSTPLRSAPLTRSHRKGSVSSLSKPLSPRSNEYFEFGRYTNALRMATDEFSLPSRQSSIESRPSVAIIRSNNCGLVRSRVNHFQEIEQAQRVETSMSGRLSALSQSSLRSADTHPSMDRFSDVSDLRHNATSSELMETTVLNTPTTTATSRVSYDSAHHY